MTIITEFGAGTDMNTFANVGKPFSARDDQLIREMHAERASVREIAPASAEHWERLANEQEGMAAFYDANGRPYGDTSAYRFRASVYRRTAKALRMEAETGKPHCSICFGDHPNHLHMHMG